MARIQSSLPSASPTDVVALLMERMKENQSASDHAEKLLRALEKKLSDEEVEDNVCRQNYGAEWRRPLSSTLNQSFRTDIDRYYRLIQEAKDSDGVVRGKITANQALLGLVLQPKAALDARLPTLEQETSSCGAEIAAISQLLAQLSDRMDEKDQVLHDFEASVGKLDVGSLLGSATLQDGVESALAHEKQFFHDHFADKMEAIIQDEETALAALQQANHGFEQKRATDATVMARQGFLQQLSDAVDVWQQLDSHWKEGQTFYAELTQRLQQLQQTVDDHCAARELERRDMELHAKASGDSRQQEARDAAMAQQMQAMDLGNAHSAASVAKDEELARQLASDTPQQYSALFPSVPPPSPPVPPQQAAPRFPPAGYPFPGPQPNLYAMYQQGRTDYANAPMAPPPGYGTGFPPPPYANYYGAPPAPGASGGPYYPYPPYPPTGFPPAPPSPSHPSS